jgi:hypothetical protein
MAALVSLIVSHFATALVTKAPGQAPVSQESNPKRYVRVTNRPSGSP